MNKVLLIGRVFDTPVTNKTVAGIKYSRFNISVTRDYEDIQDIIPIVAWRTQAEFVETYVEKGMLVAIDGSFSTNLYQDKNSVWRRKYEVYTESVTGLESRAEINKRKNTI